jgi:5-methylcytosine-specific restriction endonuclease McrA
MNLKTLKPTLSAIKTNRFKVLEAKAGTTERIRGRAWMEKRQKIALAHGYRCVDCGLIWRSHIDQIDHIIPLEQGGSNDDKNLQLLCVPCHQKKSATEAKNRSFVFL